MLNSKRSQLTKISTWMLDCVAANQKTLLLCHNVSNSTVCFRGLLVKASSAHASGLPEQGCGTSLPHSVQIESLKYSTLFFFRASPMQLPTSLLRAAAPTPTSPGAETVQAMPRRKFDRRNLSRGPEKKAISRS